MNIGNITSDNFNLDGNGKDIQIEVYEQLIEKLQQENKILRENAEHNDKVVDKVNWENMLLKKENKQLKDNWNKLKEYLHNADVVVDYCENYDGHFINYDELIDKMQELEQGSDSDE